MIFWTASWKGRTISIFILKKDKERRLRKREEEFPCVNVNQYSLFISEWMFNSFSFE
jgi:hypothetical protein